METLSLAFIGHMVGDYLLQIDWMAENKKKASLPCMIHALLYAGSICFFTGWGWTPFIFIFVIHFLQDRTTFVRTWMNYTGQAGFANGDMAPWSIVIVDNTFHLLQIWIVWKFLV